MNTENPTKGPALLIFDLDGTLALSKAPLDAEMAGLISRLLDTREVAIISGASFSQFQSQFLNHLHASRAELSHLSILPENGSCCFRYVKTFFGGSWKPVYEHKLSPEEKEKIQKALTEALSKAGEKMNLGLPTVTFGPQIEDRGSQITFSALGQQAPLEHKTSWDPHHEKRDAISKILLPLLPECDIAIGGTTSIDITKKGMNKKFGIEAISEKLGIPKSAILYVGDSIFPGGNDYAAVESGVATHQVANVSATKDFIRNMIK
jgi:HAD superfamily hydrolase (TIGR01484 family)